MNIPKVAAIAATLVAIAMVGVPFQPWSRGIGFVVLGAWGVWLVTVAIPRAIGSALEFPPFAIRIYVSPKALIDFGIARSDELPIQLGDTPPPYHPLIHGVKFTVLNWGYVSSDANRIYWNDHHDFSTDVDYRIRLDDFSRPTRSKFLPPHFRDEPQLFVRAGLEGFEVGFLAVDDFYQQDDHELAERGRTCAVLPYNGLGIKRLAAKTFSYTQRGEELKRFGWKRENNDPGCRVPERLEHEYVRVEWEYS